MVWPHLACGIGGSSQNAVPDSDTASTEVKSDPFLPPLTIITVLSTMTGVVGCVSLGRTIHSALNPPLVTLLSVCILTVIVVPLLVKGPGMEDNGADDCPGAALPQNLSVKDPWDTSR